MMDTWIWANNKENNNEYGEFYTNFEYLGGDVNLDISCDGNYSAYINGALIAFSQYPDYPHYKIKDSINVTKNCVFGENKLAIIVWHTGFSNFSTYYSAPAGLYFIVKNNNKIVAFSDKNTLSRISKTYQNYSEKIITPQLGYSFLYDSTAEDCWQNGINLEDLGFNKSVEKELDYILYDRPIKKLVIDDLVKAKVVKTSVKSILLDMRKETVGFLTLKFTSSVQQKITISYGEHIDDGDIRQKIGIRDFSVEYIAKKGLNDYTNTFLRLGLRYLKIEFVGDISIDYIGILPVIYPLKENEFTVQDPLIKQIYDTSVNTLKLCMHEHYEDCPWREQSFYALDSRNQMLCGYFAFNEFTFARAGIKLISQDNRADDLLTICYPTRLDLVIPSFNLHYIIAVYEYTKYSADTTLIKEIFLKLEKIINVFINRMQGGLVPLFNGKNYWNFYEWAEGVSDLKPSNGMNFDIILNSLMSIALSCMAYLSGVVGVDGAKYAELKEILNNALVKTFYDKSSGLFYTTDKKDQVCELGNALAVLSGATNNSQNAKIAELITNSNHTIGKTTLSMDCFKYDALLKIDKQKYSTFVLQDIIEKYSKMLQGGATSFWETIEGGDAFENAGSLCHGWSAMPVYYFNILKENL